MALNHHKKYGFLVISFEHIDLFDSNFIHKYIIIKHRSSSINDKIHRSLSELWPLTLVRILFPLNILRMNGWNLARFSYILILTRSRLGFFVSIYANLKKSYGP